MVLVHISLLFIVILLTVAHSFARRAARRELLTQLGLLTQNIEALVGEVERQLAQRSITGDASTDVLIAGRQVRLRKLFTAVNALVKGTPYRSLDTSLQNQRLEKELQFARQRQQVRREERSEIESYPIEGSSMKYVVRIGGSELSDRHGMLVKQSRPRVYQYPEPLPAS